MKSLVSLGLLAILISFVHSQSSGVGSPCSGGVCVPHYLCRKNPGVVDDSLVALHAVHCDNPVETCCAAKDRITEEPTSAPAVIAARRCGFRNPKGIGFISESIDDSKAKFGEFPWMVGILHKGSETHRNNTYLCGGALIHPKVVLTAAHCVAKLNANQLKIRAGEWDVVNESESLPHQDRDVSEVRKHEDFYAGANFHDVALLFLSTPVELADNVHLICLPTQDETFDNSRCFTTGWGKDVFGKGGRYQGILKKVELPVVPRRKCQESLRKTKLGKEFELHRTFTCAGGEPGKDACTGDGGSPLMCPLKSDPTRYVQAGIVSWGIGCGDNSIPGVYVDVAKFRAWIDDEMTYQSLDRTLYRP